MGHVQVLDLLADYPIGVTINTNATMQAMTAGQMSQTTRARGSGV